MPMWSSPSRGSTYTSRRTRRPTLRGEQ
jgi:hypothetical protein